MLAYPSVGLHLHTIIARSNTSVKTFSGLPFSGVAGGGGAGGRYSPCRLIRREDDLDLRGFHLLRPATLSRGAPVPVFWRVAKGGIRVHQRVPGAHGTVIGRPDAAAARADEFELGAALAHGGLAAEATHQNRFPSAGLARYPVCVFQPVISLSQFSRGGPPFLSCSPSRGRRKERSSRRPRCLSPPC